MRSRDELEQALSQLVESHYYSEDFELISAARAFQGQLSGAEQESLKELLAGRLREEGSMVDIVLCSVIDAPGAGPILARRLDGESTPSQLTRALIAALACYRGDEVFRAVERFVDSDQEGEALAAIARIDFRRALPWMARALSRDHLLGPVLHILHTRSKEIGVAGLVDELRQASVDLPVGFRSGILRALDAKADDYNPFSREDRDCIRTGLA